MALHKASWAFGWSKVVIEPLHRTGECTCCGDIAPLFTVTGENCGLANCRECAQMQADSDNQRKQG